MHIKIISVGTKMPAWVTEACDHYLKRCPRSFPLSLVEVPLGPRNKQTPLKKTQDKESESMLANVSDTDRIIALDVKGKAWSTEQLTENISKWQLDGVDCNLLIGGPDGLSPHCLQRAHQRWSLSALTLPHPLARLLVIEQLYRAWTVLNNHPYHK